MKHTEDSIQMCEIDIIDHMNEVFYRVKGVMDAGIAQIECFERDYANHRETSLRLFFMVRKIEEELDELRDMVYSKMSDYMEMKRAIPAENTAEQVCRRS